jgi:hypothetical protein
VSRIGDSASVQAATRVNAKQASKRNILAHAYAQCRSNKGAPGVDGQEFADIEAYGVHRRRPLSTFFERPCARTTHGLHGRSKGRFRRVVGNSD